MTCSVLIVEDDERFRDSFVRAISHAPDMTLAGIAPSYDSGFRQIAKRPDVLLVDLQLPDATVSI